MLKIEGLTKTYRTGDKALRDVSFSVPSGQVVGLLQVGVPAERADPIGAIGVGAVVSEIRDVVDVDQRAWTGEAELR